MGLEDRDWVREERQRRAGSEATRRDRAASGGGGGRASVGGGPTIGPLALAAMLLAVLAGGTAATVWIMAVSSGRPLQQVLAQVQGIVLRTLSSTPEVVAVPALLVLAALCATRLRGTVSHLLTWMLVAAGVYLLAARYIDLESRATVTGEGVIEITRGVGAHYEIDGAVDGVPVRFLVDTGASITTISEEARARLPAPGPCVPARFETAGGPVTGCILRASVLGLAGFELRDVDVAVLPRMGREALLGMNVLRRFRIEQDGKTLRLVPAGARGR